MQLYEKHRPQTFADFIGQQKIKTRLERLMSRDSWDRDAVWIEGPSGTGKTTLAWIIANSKADDLFIQELDGDKCNVQAVRELENTLILATSNDSWRVVIINEAHAMSRQAVQAWLTLLERLPLHSLVVFTTTETLTDDLFGNFSEPFASRCKVLSFSNQGLAQLFAARAKQIAREQGLDGQSEERYIRLVQQCHNNLRMVLQRIDACEMLA